MTKANQVKTEHLEEGTQPKTAAKNIRKLLGLKYPKTRFVVRCVDYTTITIKWADGPTDQQVEMVVGRFMAGKHNSMTGNYEWRKTKFNSTYGAVQYIYLDREYGDSLIIRAIDEIATKYGIHEKPTIEDVRNGKTWATSPVPGLSSWTQLIYKKAGELAA